MTSVRTTDQSASRPPILVPTSSRPRTGPGRSAPRRQRSRTSRSGSGRCSCRRRRNRRSRPLRQQGEQTCGRRSSPEARRRARILVPTSAARRAGPRPAQDTDHDHRQVRAAPAGCLPSRSPAAPRRCWPRSGRASPGDGAGPPLRGTERRRPRHDPEVGAVREAAGEPRQHQHPEARRQRGHHVADREAAIRTSSSPLRGSRAPRIAKAGHRRRRPARTRRPRGRLRDDTCRSPAMSGSTPIVANSVVPIAKPPRASASRLTETGTSRCPTRFVEADDADPARGAAASWAVGMKGAIRRRPGPAQGMMQGWGTHVPSARPTWRSTTYLVVVAGLATAGFVSGSPAPIVLAAVIALPASIVTVPATTWSTGCSRW